MTTQRLEYFSDAVFAIAATLLIIEIKPPHGEHLGRELLELWPSYAAYATSFFTIGIIWVSHHFSFDRTTTVDRPTMFINLCLLVIVAFTPFPTAVLADNLQEGHDIASVAAAFYAGTLFLMSISFNVLAGYIRRHDMVADELPKELVNAFIRKGRLGLTGYFLAIVLSFVSPYLGLAMCGVVAVFFAVPSRKAARIRAELEAAAKTSDAGPDPQAQSAGDQ